MKKRIISIEYWLDGITSSYEVTKKEYYDTYNSCYSGFKIIKYNDMTQQSFNK